MWGSGCQFPFSQPPIDIRRSDLKEIMCPLCRPAHVLLPCHPRVHDEVCGTLDEGCSQRLAVDLSFAVVDNSCVGVLHVFRKFLHAVAQSLDLALALDGVRFIGMFLEVGLDTALRSGHCLGVAFPERRSHLSDLALHRLVCPCDRRGWRVQGVSDLQDILHPHRQMEPIGDRFVLDPNRLGHGANGAVAVAESLDAICRGAAQSPLCPIPHRPLSC